jgi:hypothetical protein
MNSFFEKLFEDPVFRKKYRERWNEMYAQIVSIPDFIDEMMNKLDKSATQNFQTWWFKTFAPWTNTHRSEPNDFHASISNLKDWYNAHVAYLNTEINKIVTTSREEILQENPLKAWISNKHLYMSGLVTGEMLCIYTVTGALVYQRIATSDEAILSLPAVGVYIVRSGSNTIKVVFD